MEEKGKNFSLPLNEMELIRKVFQEDNDLGLTQDDILYLRDIIWEDIIEPVSETELQRESSILNDQSSKIHLPKDFSIANVFKEARSTLNLNQRDFAKLLGVTQTNISHIESGKNKKPTKRLIQTILPYSPYYAEEIFRLAGYEKEAITNLDAYQRSHKISGKRIILRILIERLEEESLEEVIEYILSILKGDTWF